MDFIATTLGVQLPTLKARDCLLHQHVCGVMDFHNQKIVWSFVDQEMWDVPDKTNCDDDETASTLSDADNSMGSSSDPLPSCVTFAPEVVTAVYLRPFTERDEKEALYYGDEDYRQFRMDFRRSLYTKQPVVRFSSPVVSHVHVLPAVENKDYVYYSSADLKQFLEEFILSLDEKLSS